MSKKRELDEVFASLINDMHLLLKESKHIVVRNNKEITKKIQERNDLAHLINDNFNDHNLRKKFHLIITDRDNLKKTKELSNNAIFIHCFALFEIFAKKIVEINFKNSGKSSNSPKEIYKQEFHKFVLKRLDQGDKSWTKVLMDEKEMLNNYGSLPNRMLLWVRMLDINKDDLYEQIILRYDESRERRNLLVHRGTFADSRYEKAFTELHRGPDKGAKAKKFLEETYEKFSYWISEDKEGKAKTEKPDLTVTPIYLTEVYKILLSLASIMYFSSYKLNKKEIETDSSIFPGSLLHDMMKFRIEMNSIHFIYPIINTIDEYMKNSAKESWKNIGKHDKFNYLICQKNIVDYYYETIEFIKKDKKLEKKIKNNLVTSYESMIDNRQKHIEKTKIFIHKTINKNSKRFRLISYHIDNDIDGLVKHIKTNIKFYVKTCGEDFLDDWFMFNNETYQKNKYFQSLKKTLKQ